MGGVSIISKAILQLGSNMGNSKVQFVIAQQLIEENIGKIIMASSLYLSAAWGLKKQPDFLNQVIIVETKQKASKLLDNILAIETKMGRVRNELYGPRTIDIDVLFFNNEVIKMRKLTVPHPLLEHRRFVLAPLAEIQPKFMHPLLHKTMEELLVECSDNLNVQKI
jgi:2-amino-4-hydroxy-6-hydroxymethyldihydropteridine diphosphokinase